MNRHSRVSKFRTSIAIFALIACSASSGAAPASLSASASAHTPAPAEQVSDNDYDGPHIRTLFLVLFAAAGYAMHRQQRALESLHTLQNVS